MPGFASNGIRSSFIAALLLCSRAHAAPAEPACAPLEEPEFLELVAQARSLIAQDRPTSHAAVAESLERRVPCLRFVPAAGVWAEYLVGLAAVRYLQQGDWQGPLAAALAAVPEVDRGVNANHEMGRWTPPPPPSSPGPVPEGASLFVDGVLQPDLPPAHGLHLVQVRTWEGRLTSALLRDGPVPAAWFGEPRTGPELAPQAMASAVGGLGGAWQVVEVAGPHPDDAFTLGPEVGGSVWLQVGRPVGVAVDLLATAAPQPTARFRPSLQLDGSLLVTAGTLVWTVGLGVAAATAERVVAPDEIRRSVHLQPTAAITGRFGGDGRSTVDAGVAGGWSPGFTRGALRVGVAPPGRGARMRAGLEARIRDTAFTHRASGSRLWTTDLAVLAEIGVVTGAW